MSSREKYISKIEIQSKERINLTDIAQAIGHLGTVTRLSCAEDWDYDGWED